MIEIILPSIAILISLIILIILLTKKSGTTTADTSKLEDQVQSLDRLIREEFERNRESLQKALRENREELSNSFKNLGEGQSKQFETFNKNLNDLVKLFTERTERLYEVLRETALENRTEQTKSLTGIRETVEKKLTSLQEDNSKKLEEMRKTVDEKLQEGLEKRFNESFKLISTRLEEVHKGLGEMQSLASGVGDLKKVLTNVKTRGNLGEVQLGSILEQIFSPEQYEHNAQVKANSQERVEFAVKLPGKTQTDQDLLLPIDSKFPIEDYQRLLEAYEKADSTNTDQIESAAKQFENSLKKNAKDIFEKYINPPVTTDFAIMFVPTEGLYAEVLRRTGLFESLQRTYKVTVVGPSNLVAFLSSLQMGFRTLAIEKRSSEVWNLLGAVKAEFGKFGDVLEKTKQKLEQATKTIDSAGVRTRAIERKLKDVQELPVIEDNDIAESIEEAGHEEIDENED
ncbi:MAG: DNA recombination protein RmuC [Marinilabiliales bacterium]|nr:MAG: DNA recombination protein RmuC [Marinilabiliales bacterium]